MTTTQQQVPFSLMVKFPPLQPGLRHTGSYGVVLVCDPGALGLLGQGGLQGLVLVLNARGQDPLLALLVPLQRPRQPRFLHRHQQESQPH